MAVSPIQFTPETWDQANPYLKGAQEGQDIAQKAFMFPQQMQHAMLANKIAQVQAQYALPEAQQALLKNQLYNQYYGPEMQATMGLQGAQADQASADAAKNRFMVNNPAYINFPAWYYGANGGSPASQGGAAQGGASQGNAGAAQGDAQPQASLTQSAPSEQSPNGQQYGPYGVPIPNLGPTARDPVLAKAVGIRPIDKSQLAVYQQQLADQPKLYEKRVMDSAQAANQIVGGLQSLNAFNAGMDGSFYRGPRLGAIPSHGKVTALVPGNLSPEQQADNQATNVLPLKIALVRQAMGSARFSNLDMQQAQKMSASREQTDDVRHFNQQWMSAVKDRSLEIPAFYQKLGNPHSGAMAQVADLALAKYQNDYPMISDDGKTVKKSNLGYWPLYTSPAAIQSFRDTGDYTPPKAGKGEVLMQFPDQNFRRVPNNKIKDATLKYGAKLFKVGG